MPKENEYAGFWIRFVAEVADTIIILLPSYLLIYLLGEFITPYTTLLAFIYDVYFIGKEGATPGKKLFHIYVIGENGESPIGYEKAAIRFIGKSVSALILGLGLFWIAFDSKKQGWHDKIAKTYVIYR